MKDVGFVGSPAARFSFVAVGSDVPAGRPAFWMDCPLGRLALEMAASWAPSGADGAQRLDTPKQTTRRPVATPAAGRGSRRGAAIALARKPKLVGTMVQRW